MAGLPLEMLPLRHRTVDLSSTSNSTGQDQNKSVIKTESISNIESSDSSNANSISAKRLSSRLSNGFTRASSLKV